MSGRKGQLQTPTYFCRCINGKVGKKIRKEEREKHLIKSSASFTHTKKSSEIIAGGLQDSFRVAEKWSTCDADSATFMCNQICCHLNKNRCRPTVPNSDRPMRHIKLLRPMRASLGRGGRSCQLPPYCSHLHSKQYCYCRPGLCY